MAGVLEMPIGYDKLPVNYQQVLALPFNEGAGLATYDRARPHRPEITLVGAPTWTQIAPSELTVLEFDGASNYLECPAADTPDLDFTGDYSMAVWVNHGVAGVRNPKIVVGRYEIDDVNLLDNTGWEIYLETNGPDYLELRHHHGTLGWPDQRDGCYSTGWITGVWNLLVITRSGLYPLHYRDGLSVPVTYSADGMRDPDSSDIDLVIGSRFTRGEDWYLGGMWGLRLWDRELASYEAQILFETERHLFNV